MTLINKEKAKETLNTVIELLQTLCNTLDAPPVEPDGICSYCGKIFETPLLAQKHVLLCKKNPMVVEIERLKDIVEAKNIIIDRLNQRLTDIGGQY